MERFLFPNASVGDIPAIALGQNYTSINRGGPRGNKWSTANLRGNLTIQRGRNNIKLGVDEVYRISITTTYNNPSFNFDGSMTGDALADLLIGRAYSFSQMNQPTIYNGASAIQSGLYVQDQIKAARRLVLTLGLRWELDPIYKRDRGQEFARFVPSLYDRNTASQIDPTTGTIIGTPNNTDGIQVVDSAGDVSRLDFAPRISFAYSPWGNKTVLRAGYGIFYDHLPINTGSLLSNPPFVFSETVYNVPFDDASSGQPGAQYPPSLQSLSLPVKTPMSQKYSAGIQHEFSGLMAQVDYVGDFSTNEPNYGAWYGYDQQPFYLDITLLNRMPVL